MIRYVIKHLFDDLKISYSSYVTSSDVTAVLTSEVKFSLNQKVNRCKNLVNRLWRDKSRQQSELKRNVVRHSVLSGRRIHLCEFNTFSNIITIRNRTIFYSDQTTLLVSINLNLENALFVNLETHMHEKSARQFRDGNGTTSGVSILSLFLVNEVREIRKCTIATYWLITWYFYFQGKIVMVLKLFSILSLSFSFVVR